jgi:hypothetical protein
MSTLAKGSAVQVLRTDSARRQERARFIALAIVVVAAAAALWAFSPSRMHQAARSGDISAEHSGKMLIPSGAANSGDPGDSQIDHAIARESRGHTVKQSAEPKAGTAADAIYRFEPGRAKQHAVRVMT